MKRRVLALILVLTMALSLVTACSKKSDSSLNAWDTLREMQDIKTGAFTYDFAIKMNMADMGSIPAEFADVLKDVHIKLDGVVESAESPYKIKMNIQYKLPSSDKYENLTDIVMVDGIYYINLKSIREVLQNVNDTMVSMYAGLLASDTDYISISNDDITYLAGLTGTTIDASEFTAQEGTTKAYSLLSEKLITVLQKTSEGMKNGLVTEKDGKFTINVNNDNYKDILTSFKAVIQKDGATLYNEYYDEVSKLDNVDQKLVDQLEANKDTFVTDVTTEVDKLLNDQNTDASTDVNSTITYSLEGKKGSRIADTSLVFSAKDDSNNLDLSMSGTTDEGKKVEKVTAPAEATTLTDFFNNIMSSLGGSY